MGIGARESMVNTNFNNYSVHQNQNQKKVNNIDLSAARFVDLAVNQPSVSDRTMGSTNAAYTQHHPFGNSKLPDPSMYNGS